MGAVPTEFDPANLKLPHYLCTSILVTMALDCCSRSQELYPLAQPGPMMKAHAPMASRLRSRMSTLLVACLVMITMQTTQAGRTHSRRRRGEAVTRGVQVLVPLGKAAGKAGKAGSLDPAETPSPSESLAPSEFGNVGRLSLAPADLHGGATEFPSSFPTDAPTTGFPSVYPTISSPKPGNNGGSKGSPAPTFAPVEDTAEPSAHPSDAPSYAPSSQPSDSKGNGNGGSNNGGSNNGSGNGGSNNGSGNDGIPIEGTDVDDTEDPSTGFNSDVVELSSTAGTLSNYDV
jgi:uncharacterized membrane protein YgcG